MRTVELIEFIITVINKGENTLMTPFIRDVLMRFFTIPSLVLVNLVHIFIRLIKSSKELCTRNLTHLIHYHPLDSNNEGHGWQSKRSTSSY